MVGRRTADLAVRSRHADPAAGRRPGRHGHADSRHRQRRVLPARRRGAAALVRAGAVVRGAPRGRRVLLRRAAGGVDLAVGDPPPAPGRRAAVGVPRLTAERARSGSLGRSAVGRCRYVHRIHSGRSPPRSRRRGHDGRAHRRLRRHARGRVRLSRVARRADRRPDVHHPRGPDPRAHAGHGRPHGRGARLGAGSPQDAEPDQPGVHGAAGGGHLRPALRRAHAEPPGGVRGSELVAAGALVQVAVRGLRARHPGLGRLLRARGAVRRAAVRRRPAGEMDPRGPGDQRRAGARGPRRGSSRVTCNCATSASSATSACSWWPPFCWGCCSAARGRSLREPAAGGGALRARRPQTRRSPGRSALRASPGASRCWSVSRAPSGGRDDGLDGGDEALCDLDVDHEGAEFLDRLLQQYLALVDGDAARVLDGVRDVGGRDAAEQAVALAGLGGQRDDGLVERGRELLGLRPLRARRPDTRRSPGRSALRASPGASRSWSLSRAPSGGRDDGLDGGDEALCDLDVDHEGAEFLDRLLQQHLALVDGDAARVLDGVGDVGGRDAAEEAVALAGLGGQRDDGLVERGRELLGLRGHAHVARLALFFAPTELDDLARRGRLGHLARDQVVAGVAPGHVGELALVAEVLDVLEQNDLHEVPLQRLT